MLIKKKEFFNEFNNLNCNMSVILRKLSAKSKVAALRLNNNYHSISDPKRLLMTKRFLQPKKIILIDRDGVINEKATKARYINSWSDFRFISRTFKSMKILARQGFSFIVITNQAGIERGITKIKNLNEIHRKMINKFSSHGVKILKVYYCPHHWNSLCECRKPKPGMLLKASEEFMFRLDKTFFVGDDKRDILAAKNAGSNGILWRNNNNFMDIDKIINNCFYGL